MISLSRFLYSPKAPSSQVSAPGGNAVSDKVVIGTELSEVRVEEVQIPASSHLAFPY